MTRTRLGRCVDKLHGISSADVAEIFAIVCELDRRGEFASHGLWEDLDRPSLGELFDTS